ncbi:MAG: menaquinone biosynthesis decarboxylase [Bacteroidetes bacterium]|nr:menaquinone biosynthesis decarboxylase [Bacteroidota bacterium]
MPFTDLRDYLSALNNRNELVEIKQPFSVDLDVTEIADRSFKHSETSPTLLFKNLPGHSIPVVINLFGTEKRTAFALGVNNLDEIADRIRTFTSMVPPKTLPEKIKKALQFAGLRKFAPKLVKKAPVHEIILTGDQVDLGKIPVLKCWPDDGGKFITLTAVVSKDPDTNSRNIGMYRVQVFDKNTAGLHWQRHKGGAAHHEKFKKTGGRMEVAVVLGGDPATIYSASAPLPPNIDEWFFSGFLRGKAVEIVKCKTVDLEVPAHAEIVLEGYVDLNEPLRVEGPFGDHTGFYSLADLYPAFHVTAITMRKDAIYPTTIVGIPPVEDVWLGKITERAFLPLMQVVLPEVVDYHLPPEGVFHNLVFISAKKSYPGHGWKILHGSLGLGLMMLSKVIVVLDEDAEVENIPDCWRRVMKNADFHLDVAETRGPIDALDHASQFFTYAGKLAIDASTKWDGEGREKGRPVSQLPEKIKAGLEKLKSELLGFPEIKSWSTPYYRDGDDGIYSPLFVAMTKSEPGDGKELAAKLLNRDLGGWNKLVIVVDDVENIKNPFECWWIALNHLDPLRDVVRVSFPSADKAYQVPGYSAVESRMGWDSTSKRKDEQFTREWPWKVTMPQEVKSRIDKIWPELGIR